MVAITDTRAAGFVNSAVSLVIIVLDLSYLPLSYYLGMQFLPYLAGPVQRHLKKSIFNLNKPKDVEALVYVVQEVFNAVQLLSTNEEAHTDCNFDDLLGELSGGSKENGLPQPSGEEAKAQA